MIIDLSSSLEEARARQCTTHVVLLGIHRAFDAFPHAMVLNLFHSFFTADSAAVHDFSCYHGTSGLAIRASMAAA